MADSVLMKFGDFVFGLDTAAYTELIHNTSYGWVEMNRVKGKPIHQFLGEDVSTINLSGVIFTHYARNEFYNSDFHGYELANQTLNLQIPLKKTQPIAIGDHHIEVLRKIAEEGKPQRLIDGRGVMWGWFCIKSISEHQSIFFKDGTPKKQQFDIEFIRYGADPTIKPYVQTSKAPTNTSKAINKPSEITYSDDRLNLPKLTGVSSGDTLTPANYVTSEFEAVSTKVNLPLIDRYLSMNKISANDLTIKNHLSGSFNEAVIKSSYRISQWFTGDLTDKKIVQPINFELGTSSGGSKI
jgi:uncharacterized protein